MVVHNNKLIFLIYFPKGKLSLYRSQPKRPTTMTNHVGLPMIEIYQYWCHATHEQEPHKSLEGTNIVIDGGTKYYL